MSEIDINSQTNLLPSKVSFSSIEITQDDNNPERGLITNDVLNTKRKYKKRRFPKFYIGFIIITILIIISIIVYKPHQGFTEKEKFDDSDKLSLKPEEKIPPIPLPVNRLSDQEYKTYMDKYEFEFPVNASGKPLIYTDMYNHKLRDKGHNINWQEGSQLSDGVYTYMEPDTTAIWVKYLADPSSNRIVGYLQDFAKPGFQDSNYYLSPDLRYIAVVSNEKRIWRHSNLAQYRIYSLKEFTKTPVVVASKVMSVDKTSVDKIPKLSLFKWSPIGHDVAFVENNNIFIIKDDFESIIQVTDTGSSSRFNGIPDWVCEEEVFGSDTAMWWSPDGNHLAYLSFDDSEVPIYEYPIFNPSHFKSFNRRSADEQKVNEDWLQHVRETMIKNPSTISRLAPYPQNVQIRYPKPGYPNPKVSLHVFHLDEWVNNKNYKPKSNLIPIDYQPNKSFNNKVAIPKDPIFTDVIWAIDAKSIIVRLANRVQDHVFTCIVDIGDDFAYVIRSEPAGKDWAPGMKGDDGWYPTESHPLLSIPANAEINIPHGGYIDRVIHNDRYHLALFDDIYNDQPKVFLTSGNYDVDKVIGYNTETGVIYYLSREIDSTANHLFSVSLDGKNKVHISKQDDDVTQSNFGAYGASVSPHGGYIVLSYEGPGIPEHRLLNSKTLGKGEVLESNPAIKKELQQLAAAQYHFRTVNVEGHEFNVKEIRPPTFDPSRKYRTLFRVYGGPESQLVTRGFGIDFDQWLVSNHNDTIVVIVDCRGTGFKGRKFSTIIYKKLGLWEAYDVLATGKHYAQLPYVDSNRLAIWGWSYGGYLTTKVIERNYDNVFKLGMAVAPVTDWRFYDTIYTERYMQLPTDSPRDHYLTSAINDITQFNTTQYVMFHGIADDNVHYQNSMSLIDLFELNHITKFKLNTFPDNDHGLPYYEARFELYTAIVGWLDTI